MLVTGKRKRALRTATVGLVDWSFGRYMGLSILYLLKHLLQGVQKGVGLQRLETKSINIKCWDAFSYKNRQKSHFGMYFT